jgi:hypothetical protein
MRTAEARQQEQISISQQRLVEKNPDKLVANKTENRQACAQQNRKTDKLVPNKTENRQACAQQNRKTDKLVPNKTEKQTSLCPTKQKNRQACAQPTHSSSGAAGCALQGMLRISSKAKSRVGVNKNCSGCCTAGLA